MGEGNVAIMSLPPLRGHEGLLPLQRRLCRPRCLFGRTDPLFLKDAVNQISQENKLRWNFDFENGQPMPGRYKWQYVGDADDSGGSEKKEIASENNVENTPEKELENAVKCDLKSAPVKDFETAPVVMDAGNDAENSTAKDVEDASKTKQTHITDFMRKRKSSNQKENVSAVPQKAPRRFST